MDGCFYQINNIKEGFLSICFCNVYSLCCTLQCVQYRGVSCGWAGAHNRPRIVTSGWASVAGMTRIGAETCQTPGEDRTSASSSSSSVASSTGSSSVIHPVLVSIVSVILISSLPTQVLSHKQCSHYYPRDDQVSFLQYSCTWIVKNIFFCPHYVEIFRPNAIPALLIRQCPVQVGPGSICPLMWPRSWL